MIESAADTNKRSSVASAAEPSPLRGRRSLWLKLLADRRSLFGLSMLALVLAVSLTASWISPYDPDAQTLVLRLHAPGFRSDDGMLFLLGTDQVGRDIVSRLLYGGRISVTVGLSAVLGGGVIGVLLGLTSGYLGGRVDSITMRAADVQLSFPFILLAIIIVSMVGTGVTNVIIVLAISTWVVYARTVRGSVLAVKEEQFVEAAVALGASGRRILFQHLLPNVVTPVIVISTTQIATMILLESALSFLGMGVPPPTSSWGRMLADGREYLASAWWVATFPGLAIFLTVLSINLLGDALNDIILSRRR